MWAVVAIGAGGLYVAGAFSLLSAVVFGFICFGLVFMGMMCVLPFTVSHPEPARKSAKNDEQRFEKKPTSVIEKLHAFHTGWVPSNGAEIRKSKYR